MRALASKPVAEQSNMLVPFNKPFLTGTETEHILTAYQSGHLSSNGQFTQKCHDWLEQLCVGKAFLTHSGTAALEMSSILANLQPGDEVIMPSFTFVTTASSFALRGAIPVFIDIRQDTLNIDETLIERAVTEKTKAIVPVHYAGVSCDMQKIMDIAIKHNLRVIEDAAHGLLSTYQGTAIGGIGHMSSISFHETKNIMCGEAGALLVNDSDLQDLAQVVWEKGTNRKQFSLGQVDKYTWQELGSSFAPSEITAAFLWAQMEQAQTITQLRNDTFVKYHERFANLEETGFLRRPVIPTDCSVNGHIYYIILPTKVTRDALLTYLNDRGINAVFHYIPLHSSPAGTRYGRAPHSMTNTDDLSARLLRLPLWAGMSESEIELVVTHVHKFFAEATATSYPQC